MVASRVLGKLHVHKVDHTMPRPLEVRAAQYQAQSIYVLAHLAEYLHRLVLFPATKLFIDQMTFKSAQNIRTFLCHFGDFVINLAEPPRSGTSCQKTGKKVPMKLSVGHVIHWSESAACCESEGYSVPNPYSLAR